MRLRDVTTAIVDCEHKTAPAGDGDAISVGTKDISAGRIRFATAKRVTDETYREWTRRLLPQEGDLILAREAPVGEVGRVPHGRRVCLGQRTVLVRADEAKIHPRYLQYLLLGSDVQATMHALSAGSTVSHLNVQDIRDLPLPDPPDRATQEFVAELLGALDDKIELNEALSIRLAEVAQHGFIDRLAFANTEPVVLGDIATVHREAIPAGMAPADLPYIGLDNMPPGSAVLTEWLDGTVAPSGQSSRFERGDLLFGKLRPYFKKVGVAPVAGRCSTEILVLRPLDEAYWGVLLGYVRSDSFIAHCVAVSRGTKMPRSEWRDAAAFEIESPEPEQAAAITADSRAIYDLIIEKTIESKRLRALRDRFLAPLTSTAFRVSRSQELLASSTAASGP